MGNFKFIASVLLIGLVLFFGIVHGGPSLSFFLNAHALVLVFGGTFCVFVFANSFPRISSILKLSYKIIRSDYVYDLRQTIYWIYYLSYCYNNFEGKKVQIPVWHPFLNEAVEFLNTPNISENEFEALLNTRLEKVADNYAEDAETLSALAKYPPAMGLIGATSGMINMMRGLGGADKSAIGQAMAVALVATLWGIIISNFVLLPLADHVNRMNEENRVNRSLIAEAMSMVKKKQATPLVLEFMISFTPIATREEVRRDCNEWSRRMLQKYNQSKI